MIVAAHRGFSSRAPENTLSAFRLAVAFGCPWIELDTQLSADHVPVVFHDEMVTRCTNGSGKVRELSLAELQTLDAGIKFAEAFRGEPIPTLEQVINVCEPSGVQLNIELKFHHAKDIGPLCDRVAALIERLGTPSELLLFSSFSILALKRMQQRLPEIRRGLLWKKVPQDALEQLRALEAYSAHCNYKYLTESQTRMLKQAGYPVFCYTPNLPEEVEPHRKWGVDMVMTDCPDRYR